MTNLETNCCQNCNTNINCSSDTFSDFIDVCEQKLDQYVSCKQKYARGNHLSFMNNTLWKERTRPLKKVRKIKESTQNSKTTSRHFLER